MNHGFGIAVVLEEEILLFVPPIKSSTAVGENGALKISPAGTQALKPALAITQLQPMEEKDAL